MKALGVLPALALLGIWAIPVQAANNAELLVAEADALMRSKRPGEAIGVYRNASTVGANRDTIAARIATAQTLRRSLLVTCLKQQGRVAERACEAAWLPGAPDEVAVFKRRGLLLRRGKQPGEALDAYMAAARLRPTDREVAHAIVTLGVSTDRRDASTLTAVGTARRMLSQRNKAIASSRSEPRADAVTEPIRGFSNQADATRSN